jgi:hypothetical protein
LQTIRAIIVKALNIQFAIQRDSQRFSADTHEEHTPPISIGFVMRIILRL